MNYRHAYHAGNFADVFKHALLAVGLEYLKAKVKPFVVLDTHAGVGLYDLAGEEAGKTGEWVQGIGRLMAHPAPPAALAPYLEVVRGLNPDGGLRRYPGSPWLAKALTRPQDRLVLHELHPVDSRVLSETMRGDDRITVHAADGYAGLKAALPPKERRGLVLVDPPFEKADEFDAMLRALRAGVKRWATGICALWYPIKDPLEVAAFHARVEDLGVPKTYALDLYVRRPVPGVPRLDGCGFVFVNPPFGLLQSLDTLMPFLTDLLAQGDGAGWEGRWLVGETVEHRK